MENDAPESGESLSIAEAASRYAQTLTSEEVDTDHADDDENEDSDLPEDELQASDEDESEDVEGEPDLEDQAEEGEDDDPESEGGRFVGDNAKVRLADGTVTTIAELKSGSLRNADYTRKTQEVAEQRRALETQSQAFEASQKELAQQREYVTQLLQSLTPQPPDPALLSSDPLKYMQDKANYEAFVQHQQYVQGLTAEDKKKAEEKAASERQNRINSEWGQLLAKAPDLNDKAKFSAFEADVFKFGTEYGFSRDELINGIPMDHRQALVLKDAIAYRKLKAAQPKVAKKVENRPPVVKGGKRLSPQAQKARQSSDAYTKAKKSGSVDDVTAAYLASLNR